MSEAGPLGALVEVGTLLGAPSFASSPGSSWPLLTSLSRAFASILGVLGFSSPMVLLLGTETLIPSDSLRTSPERI